MRILYCITALLLSVIPARAGFIQDVIVFSPTTQTGNLQDLSAPPQGRLGLAFPGARPAYYSALANVGMGVARLAVAWKHREPAPGNYDWANLDSRIIEAQSLGIEPFLTLQSNAAWAVRPETSEIANGTPITMADWTTFVSRTVDRYDGDGWNDAPGLLRPVRYYQAANEWSTPNNAAGGWLGTDAELVEFVNATYSAVKTQMPSATFVLGGITSGHLDVLVLNRGLADYEMSYRSGPDAPFITKPASDFRTPAFDDAVVRGESLIRQMNYDAVDLHLYGPAGRDPARIQVMRDIVGNVPLLSAECGGPSMYYQDYVPEDHFMSVVERNLIDLSNGLEFCLWFRLMEGTGTTFGNSRTALFNETLVAKPGYDAYAFLAYILQGMTSIERGTGNRFTIYRDGMPPLVVGWLEDGQSSGYMTLPNNVTGSVMTVTDPIAGTYEVAALSGFGAIPLSRWPTVAGELP